MRKVSSGHLLSIGHDSVCGQQRPWPDCADAQADLSLLCPHMPEGTFLDSAAHMVVEETSNNEHAKWRKKEILNQREQNKLKHLWAGTQHFLQYSSLHPASAGLGGLVGCASDWWSGGCGFNPAGSTMFFRWGGSWNTSYGNSLPSADSRRAVVSFWRKNVHNIC